MSKLVQAYSDGPPKLYADSSCANFYVQEGRQLNTRSSPTELGICNGLSVNFPLPLNYSTLDKSGIDGAALRIYVHR